MTISLDTRVTLVAGLAAATTARPSCLVLPDRTTLVAWTESLWHVTADGTVPAPRTIPGGGHILAPTSDGGALLLTPDAATVTKIAPDGSPGATHADPTPPPWGPLDHAVAPLVHGDLTVVVAVGQVSTYTSDGGPAGTWPLPSSIYPVAAWTHPDHLTILGSDGTVLHVTPAGATTVATLPLPAGHIAYGGTDPAAGIPVTLTDDVDYYGARLTRGETTVATDGIDDVALSASLGHTSATSLGMVTASEWNAYDYGDDGIPPATILVHYYTPGGDLHVYRDDPTPAMMGAFSATPVTSHHGGRVAVVHMMLEGAAERRHLLLWLLTVPHAAADSRLKVKTLDGWRRVGLESWEDGPGRLKLRVPTSVSSSGWVMEVKPGDDATDARPMRLRLVDPATGIRYEQAVRFIPWVRP